MLAILRSCTILGYEGVLTQVEVDVSTGFPSFEIVGLADTAVKESKERVRAAMANNGFKLPADRITINLAPAAIKKHGPVLDLPIALGILMASGQIPTKSRLSAAMVCGELSLEGRIRPITGALSMAIVAKRRGIDTLIVPTENAAEAAAVTGLKVIAADSISTLVDWSLEKIEIPPAQPLFDHQDKPKHDLAQVKGQHAAKRALEIAAAGGHNLLLIGPPGSGKTMLANCLPSILPPLDQDQSLEVSQIYSVAGQLTQGRLISRPPFRNPHHSASLGGIVGGGTIPRPGEISLAHRGVLFLDEFPEFRREVIEVLRQPLEEGTIAIARTRGTYRYPASFLLVASANPCPCGFWGVTGAKCKCTAGQIAKYRSKFSGPILDRIDLWTEVPAVAFSKLRQSGAEETSLEVRNRVLMARETQHKRFTQTLTNSQMTVDMVDRYCKLIPEAERILANAFRQLKLSARSYQRILKVARTIADLDNRQVIQIQDLTEALSYRSMSWEDT